MHINNVLKKEINNAPPLPPDIYPAVQQQLRKERLLHRSLLAVAATIIITIGLLTVRHIQPHYSITAEETDQKVSQELLLVSNYLNATDIEEYATLYTIVDNY